MYVAEKQNFRRIWENLSEEGWGEEIAARKEQYQPGLLAISGVATFHPLDEYGAHIQDPQLLLI